MSFKNFSFFGKHKESTQEQASNTQELSKPKSQVAEALRLLIEHNPRGLTRASFMNEAWIMNAPDCVMRLRKQGVKIRTVERKKTNKFGRDISFGIYILEDKAEAVEQYNRINQ